MTTRREKTIAGVLIFFGVVTLVLGFAQIQKTLRFPLLFDPPKKNETPTTPANRLGSTIDPTKDTDGDGLPDIDELNRYGTSPYLADSDSDNRVDQEEITQGTDPNCPEGKQCGLVVRERAESQKQPKTIADILEREATVPEANTSAGMTQTGEASLTSAAQLRAALLAEGVSKAQLDQVDDATLISMYRETEQEIQQQKQTTQSSTEEAPPQVTGAQLRALLRAQGMTEEELAQIDDATLERLLRETKKQQSP